MPIRRKICRIGGSKAVFLPKTWIDLLEEEHGQIRTVSIEVSDKLIIKPILKEDSGHG